MGETDFGFIALFRDIESDLRALPLAFVFGKIKVVVQHKPGDFFVWN